jgi:hypothetical protein
MKVTAIIPDAMVAEVKTLAHGKNITESLITALDEWIKLKRLQGLNEMIMKKPLRFKDGFSALSVRELNRKS